MAASHIQKEDATGNVQLEDASGSLLLEQQEGILLGVNTFVTARPQNEIGRSVGYGFVIAAATAVVVAAATAVPSFVSAAPQPVYQAQTVFTKPLTGVAIGVVRPTIVVTAPQPFPDRMAVLTKPLTGVAIGLVRPTIVTLPQRQSDPPSFVTQAAATPPPVASTALGSFVGAAPQPDNYRASTVWTPFPQAQGPVPKMVVAAPAFKADIQPLVIPSTATAPVAPASAIGAFVCAYPQQQLSVPQPKIFTPSTFYPATGPCFWTADSILITADGSYDDWTADGWAKCPQLYAPQPFGGGGFHKAKPPKKKRHKHIDRILSDIPDIYASLTKTDKRKVAGEIVQPYAATDAKVPRPPSVDWAALESDAQKVSALYALWNQHQIDLDDEDFWSLV